MKLKLEECVWSGIDAFFLFFFQSQTHEQNMATVTDFQNKTQTKLDGIHEMQEAYLNGTLQKQEEFEREIYARLDDIKQRQENVTLEMVQANINGQPYIFPFHKNTILQTLQACNWSCWFDCILLQRLQWIFCVSHFFFDSNKYFCPMAFNYKEVV